MPLHWSEFYELDREVSAKVNQDANWNNARNSLEHKKWGTSKEDFGVKAWSVVSHFNVQSSNDCVNVE